MINRCFIRVVVSQAGEESLAFGELERPLIKGLTCDSNGEVCEVSLCFSSLSGIRHSQGVKKGDVLFIEGTVGEFPKDNMIIYPVNMEEIYRDESSDLSRGVGLGIVKNACREQKNFVAVEGVVKAVYDDTMLISFIPAMQRGEVSKQCHLVVGGAESDISAGQTVLFVGEPTKKGLVGSIYYK